MANRLTTALLLLFVAGSGVRAERLPAPQQKLLEHFCLDCHDAETRKGEVTLALADIAWNDRSTQSHWERVLKAVQRGEMPPPKKRQPSAVERTALVTWLDRTLTRHSQPGGTVARRLNRAEYRNTINALFGIDFELPPGFPMDTESHGFDNLGEALVLSPPLMSAYADAAALIADEIFPPVRPAPESLRHPVAPGDLTISYSSGSLRGGAMRLAIKDPALHRSCTWPSKVEVPASGIYRIRIDLACFAPRDPGPMLAKVLARDVSDSDGVTVDSLRVLRTIEVRKESPESFTFDAELYEGQTVVIYWADAPLSGEKPELESYLRSRFSSDRRLLAAWQQVEHNSSLRGGLGWERVKRLMADEKLDLSHATMDSPETGTLIKTMLKNPVLYYETIAFDHYENGPALEVHGLEIEGPLKIVDGPRDRLRQRVRDRLLGRQGDQPESEWTRAILKRFLSRAWRRPLDDASLDAYTRLVAQHRSAGHSFDEGMHLAIRTALLSPRFLYRGLIPGKLDDHDLATRLAYFLTGAPPDEKLRRLADKGGLGEPEALRKAAGRLLPEKSEDFMIKSFTGQWLDASLIAEIMPDPRLKFSPADQTAARKEIEMFFTEMLAKNRPLSDFIDPDFTYTTAAIAKKVYGLKQGYNAKSKNLQRIALPRGGRHGGVLGQVGVLLATANGVDTQPVVRGVWVLDNIIGEPPPPPPKVVPAITPDTAGAKTPRDLLAAHASDPGCASCHRKIDPIGFALENFDAVGRWRETYVIHTTDAKGRPVEKPGRPIDASGRLPDGTPIANILDLKRWLVANVDKFSSCLAEKLLTYATGRVPGYAERKEVARIVKLNHTNGNRFQDLLLDLIDSETFRTK